MGGVDAGHPDILHPLGGGHPGVAPGPHPAAVFKRELPLDVGSGLSQVVQKSIHPSSLTALARVAYDMPPAADRAMFHRRKVVLRLALRLSFFSHHTSTPIAAMES